MTNDELIEKMARAIVQSFFDIGHNIYYENPETLKAVSLAAKTAFKVCRPIIENQERERCAKIAEQARDDTCDGPVAWSMADGIAAAIRESGNE